MKAIDDYINGNLADAKKAAKGKGWDDIYIRLRSEYGMSERESLAIADYLKGQGSFQAACDAAQPMKGEQLPQNPTNPPIHPKFTPHNPHS